MVRNRVIENYSDEMVLLRLLEAHCLPILTYAVETIYVANRDDRRQFRVAYSAIYRNVFSYRYFESVTNLKHQLKRDIWEELIEKRTKNFLKKCAQ